MSLPKQYIELVKNKGIPLEEIGINSVALGRLDALEAIRLLRGSRFSILGGDVLKLKNGRAEHTYDNWFCEHVDNETEESYRVRSWNFAEQYIRRYPANGHSNTVLFVLVVSDQWFHI